MKNTSTVLSNALAELSPLNDPNLLGGLQRTGSTTIYGLSPEKASINTVELIPQPVPDPYWFGQLAAAHALTKVYVLGGQPVTALNLVLLPGEQRSKGTLWELLRLALFPSRQLDQGMLREMLRGGSDKMVEAGVCLAGGHLLYDKDPRYGFSVNGVVHPEQITTPGNAQPGDALVLTKPLGTGVLFEAVRKGKYSFQELEKETLPIMASLNKTAMETAQSFDIHACADVGDSGILACLQTMASSAQVKAVLRSQDLPVYPGARAMYQKKIIPDSNRANQALLAQEELEREAALSSAEKELLYDPQISGGLVLALPQDQAGDLLKALHAHGVETACRVGEFIAGTVGIRVA
ncbi:selenide, water dikinase SelD [Candidatus Electrothrix sp.]|uniref:selenide, water dikinase SelD n=1 Tax=Candidatus Electrothrix sp. TaxID=2170559 RepID=UPI004057254E